jgi:hypothetical protein
MFDGGGGGEPPWSDALAGRSGSCCRGSLSLLDRIREHPWISLGVLVAVVAVVKGKS